MRVHLQFYTMIRTEELTFQLFLRRNAVFPDGEEGKSTNSPCVLSKLDLFSKSQWAHSYSTEKVLLN